MRLVMQKEDINDVSLYTQEGDIGNAEDVIELACALASINRLHEIGEVAFTSDNLFETGQLSIIRGVLKSLASSEVESQENMVSLYRKLQAIKG